MTKEELSRILDLSPAHSIIVDLRDALPPGIMRVTTIHRGGHRDDSVRVSIEWISSYCFLKDPAEQGVLKCIGQYTSCEEMIADLEEYLRIPIDQWRDCSPHSFTPLVVCEDAYTPDVMKYFEDLVRTHALQLPRRVSYRFGDIYWDQISRFGEFRSPYFEEDGGPLHEV
jgi:hypothetical protein